jgi:hypothetical protein
MRRFGSLLFGLRFPAKKKDRARWMKLRGTRKKGCRGFSMARELSEKTP